MYIHLWFTESQIFNLSQIAIDLSMFNFFAEIITPPYLILIEYDMIAPLV